jgi:hypothetical protein
MVGVNTSYSEYKIPSHNLLVNGHRGAETGGSDGDKTIAMIMRNYATLGRRLGANLLEDTVCGNCTVHPGRHYNGHVPQ